MTSRKTQPERSVATVDQPGPLTLFVDAGRFGWAHLAVPTAGPYDRTSFERANRLVGNYPEAASLEILMGPLTLHFDSAATFALTGVVTAIDTSVRSNPPFNQSRQRRYGSETTLTVPAGTIVRINPFRSGVRGYLAIRGGWAAPTTLGSRSSDTLSDLGPQPLHSGQLLRRGAATASLPYDEGRILRPTNEYRVMVDQSPLWSSAAFDWLLSTAWRVSPDSDRIGMRLVPTTPTEAPTPPPTTVSVPLVRGAVQVPPSGSPVIMGPDHPTTGGYPIAGIITRSSSDALAQARPGDAVTFMPTPPIDL